MRWLQLNKANYTNMVVMSKWRITSARKEAMFFVTLENNTIKRENPSSRRHTDHGAYRPRPPVFVPQSARVSYGLFTYTVTDMGSRPSPPRFPLDWSVARVILCRKFILHTNGDRSLSVRTDHYPYMATVAISGKGPHLRKRAPYLSPSMWISHKSSWLVLPERNRAMVGGTRGWALF